MERCTFVCAPKCMYFRNILTRYTANQLQMLTSTVAEGDFILKVNPKYVHCCCHSVDRQRIVDARGKKGYYVRNSTKLSEDGGIHIISNTELREKVDV